MTRCRPQSPPLCVRPGVRPARVHAAWPEPGDSSSTAAGVATSTVVDPPRERAPAPKPKLQPMPTDVDAPVGYALLGCGSFGQYCLEQYRSVEQVRLVAVADARRDVAEAVGKRFGVPAYDGLAGLLREPAVELVHLATPPTTHAALAIAAIEAGRHVLCEKPLATTLADATRMVDAARRGERVLAANLMMRYDPLCIAVERIVNASLLGEPLHGFFENYAKDEQLGPDHWFWKPESSGGVFVEHGVHFFDLFAMWFGEGRILAAQRTLRPDAETEIVEQVHATARYGPTNLVNFYHGFHQAQRMDRQEMRLVFERGDIRLMEWLPSEFHLDAILDQQAAERVAELLPDTARLECLERYEGDARHVRSRHKAYQVDGRYAITCALPGGKAALYGQTLRDLLRDQARAIRQPGWPRRVTERNGVESLRMASDATLLAASYYPGAGSFEPPAGGPGAPPTGPESYN